MAQDKQHTVALLTNDLFVISEALNLLDKSAVRAANGASDPDVRMAHSGRISKIRNVQVKIQNAKNT